MSIFSLKPAMCVIMKRETQDLADDTSLAPQTSNSIEIAKNKFLRVSTIPKNVQFGIIHFSLDKKSITLPQCGLYR